MRISIELKAELLRVNIAPPYLHPLYYQAGRATDDIVWIYRDLQSHILKQAVLIKKKHTGGRDYTYFDELRKTKRLFFKFGYFFKTGEIGVEIFRNDNQHDAFISGNNRRLTTIVSWCLAI